MRLYNIGRVCHGPLILLLPPPPSPFSTPPTPPPPKAYSVYDEEVGYCQGFSFIAAVLLLHMPEEEAFAVFVKIMSDYGVREMYKSGFVDLHLRLFQLEQLIEEYIPDLRAHFRELGLEVHMFASQWFLTLFAAKFPLPVAFRVMDIFLSEGAEILLQISLGLLKRAKKGWEGGDDELLVLICLYTRRCLTSTQIPHPQ